MFWTFLIRLIFFTFSLYREILKFWLYQTFGWECILKASLSISPALASISKTVENNLTARCFNFLSLSTKKHKKNNINNNNNNLCIIYTGIISVALRNRANLKERKKERGQKVESLISECCIVVGVVNRYRFSDPSPGRILFQSCTPWW